ncbi:hypothetical protein JMJ77_0006609 [Colletotrichum scovillei]|uniref:Uncharacterized protein n=1 Tax=Colletotrichum scovillei TaxID=1209932 RepID=A0A9P7UL95_9PEZI|nr:hypothetical protein JMJ77_0006609 [Colletotrichum scovillei]KAG7077790.1 hypothetical protein JMJ76_0015032 [Colletotrichum scovillei]KAG7084884.1 hypothetical protein JMJ78_0010314 [Colletotrichum scovillei]
MATTPPIDDQSERYLVVISRIAPARPMMDSNPRYPTSPRERAGKSVPILSTSERRLVKATLVESMSKKHASHLLGRLNANLHLGFGFVAGRFDETLPRH